mmetsp:Transcript_36726/g.36999  ORF Transcript_36726/g.36999 Transcript_36726/m.36999 type:complete len:82 (-) Transcript_36726:1572-1817(-)
MYSCYLSTHVPHLCSDDDPTIDALIDFLQNFVSQKFRLLPHLNHITNVTVFTYISHVLSSILASYKRLQKNNHWRKGVVTT